MVNNVRRHLIQISVANGVQFSVSSNGQLSPIELNYALDILKAKLLAGQQNQPITDIEDLKKTLRGGVNG